MTSIKNGKSNKIPKTEGEFSINTKNDNVVEKNLKIALLKVRIYYKIILISIFFLKLNETEECEKNFDGEI